MFICSVKASTLKIICTVALSLAAALALIIALPTEEAVTAGSIPENKETVSYDRIKTEKARRDFLSQFGWQVSEECTEKADVTIPKDFDKVLSSYNDLQRTQGLDLSKYKGKTVQRYTYEILNYPDYSGTVYGNIIVYKNRVIGGDVCSADVEGFIHSFEMPR